MRPLVGITAIPRERVSEFTERTHATLNEAFAAMTEEAGGTPIVLTTVADVDALAARLDALVLSGGGDIEPERYGAERHPATTWLDGRRDVFELELVRAARERGLPLLGVCRGMQVVNVALGGTLVQHLPDVTELPHEVPDAWNAGAHPIDIAEDSRLRDVLGETRIEVNSVHHQALDRLGAGLRAVAWAPDDVVEAVEARDEPIIAVQWHPEWAEGVEYGRQRRLFEDLVAHTRERGR